MTPAEIKGKVEELKEKKVKITMVNRMVFEDASLVGYGKGFVFFVLKSGTPMSTPDYCITDISGMPEKTEMVVQDCEGNEVKSHISKGFEQEIITLGAAIAGINTDEVSHVFMNVEGFAGELTIIVNYDVYMALAEAEEGCVDFGEDEHAYNIGTLSKYFPNVYRTILELSKQYTIPALQYERDDNILYISGNKKN